LPIRPIPIATSSSYQLPDAPPPPKSPPPPENPLSLELELEPLDQELPDDPVDQPPPRPPPALRLAA
jgi:hypothetical protein